MGDRDVLDAIVAGNIGPSSSENRPGVRFTLALPDRSEVSCLLETKFDPSDAAEQAADAQDHLSGSTRMPCLGLPTIRTRIASTEYPAAVSV